jgi:biopolymer transport protein ExbD
LRRPLAGQQEEENSEINLTPMLDVVFIMLIFFIVTATFIKEVGLDVNSPDPNKTPPPPDPDKKSIVVKVTSRDRILIAQRDVDWRSVRANIERLHAENPEAPVVIVPHKESTTGALVHIMDSARLAGVYDVKLGSIAE